MDKRTIEKPAQFKECPPVEWWAGEVATAIPDDAFEQRLNELSGSLNFRFSGYRTPRNKDGVFTYSLSAYVRRNFGPLPTIEQYRNALRAVTESTGGISREEEKTEQPRFRVLFGLVEGYDPAQTVVHTPEEIKNILGDSFVVESVEILGIGGGRDRYVEPAAVVEGDLAKLNQVYELADRFRQERIIVQDMQAGKSYAVETRWCKQPDETPVG